MKIANEQTFREFDNFKDNIFRKKKDNHVKKIVPNPLSSKFRLLLPISLIAGGLWLAYKNTRNIRDILLEREIVRYQQLIAFETVRKVMKCRWEELWLNPRGATNPNLAN